MQIIFINGPINSGKTTIGRALAARLPDAGFIDGDDGNTDAGADLQTRIVAALDWLEQQIETATKSHLVVAYPLRIQDHARFAALARQKAAKLTIITLSPPLAVALANRGNRPLSAWEVRRIREMYLEGYHQAPFSDLILDNATLSVEEGINTIAEFLGISS